MAHTAVSYIYLLVLPTNKKILTSAVNIPWVPQDKMINKPRPNLTLDGKTGLPPPPAIIKREDSARKPLNYVPITSLLFPSTHTASDKQKNRVIFCIFPLGYPRSNIYKDNNVQIKKYYFYVL